MCHSFNHQFRFNNNHQYNSSFGKNRSYFSDRQRKDLYVMKQKISTDIVVTSNNFIDIDYSDFDEGDLQIALDEIEYRIKHLERAT